MADAGGELLDSVTYLVMKAGTLLHELVDQVLAQHGLTGRQYLVLTHAAAGELSQRELSDRLGLDPTLLVGVVDDLVAAGLVERHRDEKDRRRNVLRVTRAGTECRRTAARAVASLEADFFASAPVRDRERVAATLKAALRPHMPWLDR